MVWSEVSGGGLQGRPRKRRTLPKTLKAAAAHPPAPFSNGLSLTVGKVAGLASRALIRPMPEAIVPDRSCPSGLTDAERAAPEPRLPPPSRVGRPPKGSRRIVAGPAFHLVRSPGVRSPGVRSGCARGALGAYGTGDWRRQAREGLDQARRRSGASVPSWWTRRVRSSRPTSPPPAPRRGRCEEDDRGNAHGGPASFRVGPGRRGPFARRPKPARGWRVETPFPRRRQAWRHGLKGRPAGFHGLPRREAPLLAGGQENAGWARPRRLARDRERPPETGVAMPHVAMSRTMLGRVAREPTRPCRQSA